MNLDDSHKEVGVYYYTDEEVNFSDIYISIRKKEQRILSDTEVSKLPSISSSHPYFHEWKLRQESTLRFINYLSTKSTILSILDIGCGNGWFTNTMVIVSKKHNVIGLDVNRTELEQAVRVFKKNNLQFVYGNIFNISCFKQQFDIITLNASIQYFSDLKMLLSTLKSFLKPYGEIHIIDSPFYKSKEIYKAKKRTNDYYSSLGFPEMTDHYFHHTLEGIKNYQVMYKPNLTVYNKLLRKKPNPFYWVKILK